MKQDVINFGTTTATPLVVAYGMGVNSTALLIEFRRRGIRPDLILFADTGSEKAVTYAYRPVIEAWLARVGLRRRRTHLTTAATCRFRVPLSVLMSSPSSPTDLVVPSPDWQPVTFRGWRCNGSLDPLIRDYAHLGELCRDNPAEITEAGRICAIALRHRTYPESPESARAVFETWQAERRVPSWQRRAEHLSDIRTPAQFLAKHGNTHCRAACADAADLAHCAKLVGSYNGFDAPLFIRHLAEFNRRVFFNPCNPNNGGDLFHYTFGWEGSHVVYVEFNAMSDHELNAASTHWRKLTAAQFRSDCQTFGDLTHADENQPVTDDDGRVTWRLWWD